MTVQPNYRRMDLMALAMSAREFEIRREEPRADLLTAATDILLDEALGRRLKDQSQDWWEWRVQHMRGMALKYRNPPLVRIVLALLDQAWTVDTTPPWLQAGLVHLPGTGQRVIVPGKG